MLKSILASEIANHMLKRYTIVNVHAQWCGPCKMMTPIVEAMGQEDDPRYDILRIDADQNREFTAAKKLQSIPTTFVYEGTKLIDTIVGFASKEMLIAKIA